MSRARSAVADGCLPFSMSRKFAACESDAVRFDHGLSLANAVVSRDDHGDLRSDANRLVNIRFAVVVLFVRIVERQRRNRGAQHVHGQSMARRIAQQRDDRGIQLALFGQAFVQFAQFAARGQFAKPEQVAGLFEIRMVGEFVNVDAAIGQNAAISVDVANLGSGGNDALKSLGGVSCGHAGH